MINQVSGGKGSGFGLTKQFFSEKAAVDKVIHFCVWKLKLKTQIVN